MAPSGLVKRANVSRSDVTIATVLPTYFCICGEYILVGNVIMDQLARRPIDKSFVLRNVTTERFGPKHIYKLNADGEKEAIYIQREQPNGTKAYEKVWRKKCPRCELTVAYETTDPRDKRMGDFTFVLNGALSEEQTAIPTGAFGDEPPAE